MSNGTQFDKLDILGVQVDAISVKDAIDFVTARAAPGGKAAYVIKPYVEFLDQAYHNEALRDVLNHADLAVADGVALTWAAAYLYAGKRSLLRFWKTLVQIIVSPDELRWPLPDRAAGINFTLPLLEAAARDKLKVFLIGNPKNGRSIGHTAVYLHSHLPELKIVGTLSGRDPTHAYGRVGEAWYRETESALAASAPDIILVGMGFPLQEEVTSTLAARTKHGVYIGEGGTFDYAAFGGGLPKAPVRIQKLGLEWLWRLAREPHRLGRQLAIPRFIYRVWKNR